jgi:tetratricopeptide (TPR) repeat protein
VDDGKRSEREFSLTVDGHPATSGDMISIGRHRVVLSHPKAEPLHTNLFVWYGGTELGDLVLKRTMGELAIAADPAPRFLTIIGPEFSVKLTNCPGVTSSIPTDMYRIQAHWAHHTEITKVALTPSHGAVVRYSPPLGTVALYSDPSGAKVVGRDGALWGTTPAILQEMSAGAWEGELRLEGFVPVSLSLAIKPNQTTSVHTNLVNWQYAQAIKEAKRVFAKGDYDRTLEFLGEALKIQTNDPEATALRDKASEARHMQRGRGSYKNGDYAEARREIEGALGIEPENSEAKALLENIGKQQEQALSEQRRIQKKELAERTRRERLGLLDQTMDSITRDHVDAYLFNVQTVAFTNSVKELGNAVRNALLTKPPVFEVNKYDWSTDELFVLEAKQQVSGGLRQCLIVGTQVSDTESAIAFRMLEYETHLNFNLGGVLRVSDGQPPLVALPNRKDRVVDGIQSITSRIKSAMP